MKKYEPTNLLRSRNAHDDVVEGRRCVVVLESLIDYLCIPGFKIDRGGTDIC